MVQLHKTVVEIIIKSNNKSIAVLPNGSKHTKRKYENCKLKMIIMIMCAHFFRPLPGNWAFGFFSISIEIVIWCHFTHTDNKTSKSRCKRLTYAQQIGLLNRTDKKRLQNSHFGYQNSHITNNNIFCLFNILNSTLIYNFRTKHHAVTFVSPSLA